MFLGHFGVGFGAKAAAPKTSLGTLFLAAQFTDLLWPSLLLMGLETVRIAPGITTVTPLGFTDSPITHSLAAVLMWAVVFAGACLLLKRYPKGAWICGLAVLSHWVLDALTHRPDLPLVPGGATRVGLGLWSSLPATLVVELGLFRLGSSSISARPVPPIGSGLMHCGRWSAFCSWCTSETCSAPRRPR